ncbi:hypothetical protein BV22DRAFT_250690 [Leucogyrophana mollusca]|uniref:Uncharacterized protein n=1 Tax=Leucogyrophana mollusca TaxID=85980 RepID=A0ACB8BQ69_9AGAM|nr:hypothetical protein BV22DRAFT_250690 [Leucogyrophana mollusca]
MLLNGGISNGTHPSPSSLQEVPLRTGPPTYEELLVHYPAKFTWTQLKTFVNSGDLGLLKRDKKLQIRYNVWAKGIRQQYGSIGEHSRSSRNDIISALDSGLVVADRTSRYTVDYLINHRLQWGKPDTLSLLPSALDDQPPITGNPDLHFAPSHDVHRLPPIPKDAPEYFNADIPPTSELISIIQNDWPYSVPPEIEHTLVWTRLPIFHPKLVAPEIDARIQQDGLCGFTGSVDPPPSPSTLPECLPALAEWGITMNKLIRSPKGSEEEEDMVKTAGDQVGGFVRKRWDEREWETAWFVNPPRLQSVPGLAHIHVFARKKSPEEVAAWRTK